MGDALLVGRKLHKADQKFSLWCKESGFGDMDNRVRSDALWLADNWLEVSTVWKPGYTHPTHIRAEFRAVTLAPLTGLDISDVTPQLQIDRKVASRINKLSAMATMGESLPI